MKFKGMQAWALILLVTVLFAGGCAGTRGRTADRADGSTGHCASCGS